MRITATVTYFDRTRKLLSGKIGSAFDFQYQLAFVLLLIGLITAIATPKNAAAQTGIVSGEITDSRTGESLVGVNILIRGTEIGTAADIDGRYILRRVPAGDHILLFRYIGYETQEREITVTANETLTVNISLAEDVIQGQEIQVTARQRGQSRAFSQQRNSANIKNVVSSDQINAFADNTVTGALSRVPGMGHGGANIRGVGAGSSNVTMDGQRMGATGDDRSVDLSTISADMVQELEVIKVITPDMDADALAGVINVNTRRPVGGDRSVNIRVGGGFQDRYLNHTGPVARTSFSYGDSPSDKYSFGVNFSFQRDPQASESFTTTWGAPRSFDPPDDQEFDDETFQKLFDGPKDRLANLSNQVNFDQRDRYGTGLQLTFQPTNRSTYHVQGMFNVQDRERRRHGMTYNPRMENYTTPLQTGPRPGENQGNMGHNARLDESITHQYTIQTGARHVLDNFDLEYSLGWGHGRFEEDQYRINFQTFSRHEFIFNLDDRWNPTVEIAPWSENASFPTPTRLPMQTIDHRIDKNTNNDFKGSIDIETPYRFGDLKFGSSASMRFMRGTGERLNRSYRSTLNVGSFQNIENANWSIFGRDHQTYQIPWIIDLQKAKEFYIQQTPNFQTNMEQWALSTETSNYTAQEHTYAGYGMFNFRINWFTLLGGVRLEHTFTDYTGREGAIDASGNFLGATDISSENSYTNIFPNAQTVFRLGRLTNFRLAYSRSIGRPNFNQLNPYILRDFSSRTIQQGNPELDPMLSNNFDLLFEHYFMNVGQITLGLFYKDMKDFVFSFTERIQEGDEAASDQPEFAGWTRTGFRNGEKATVYGVELSWQQNLEFLPGFLGNIGTYVTYSYSQSIADLDREVEEHTHGLASLLSFVGFDVSDDYKQVTPLVGQRPHVLNLGLDYTHNKFFGQISYQWGAPSISSYGNLRLVPEVPDIPITQRVQFDQFNDAANDLSLTLRYRITSNFRVWADASNILNHRSISYFYNREYYPDTASLSGRRINMGLHYNF